MPKFPEINERQKPTNLKSTENPEQDTHTGTHTYHSQAACKTIQIKQRENLQGNQRGKKIIT